MVDILKGPSITKHQNPKKLRLVADEVLAVAKLKRKHGSNSALNSAKNIIDHANALPPVNLIPPLQTELPRVVYSSAKNQNFFLQQKILMQDNKDSSIRNQDE